MKGHDALIEMRKAGGKPAGVWINYAYDPSRSWAFWPKYKGFDKYPEVEILPSEVPELLDLRFVIGLVVHASVPVAEDFVRARRLHKAIVNARAKRVITVCGKLIIDSEYGEWKDYVPE